MEDFLILEKLFRFRIAIMESLLGKCICVFSRNIQVYKKRLSMAYRKAIINW